jgi:hypothetical protein
MEDTIAAWLNQQDNVITRMQALEVMSLETLRHRLGRRWQILLPGVYVATTGTPTDRQRLRAAILYGGDSAQLCDTTALLAYRVRYVPADPEIRLLLSAHARRANRDGVAVRRTHRLPPPRLLGGLPHCPPERALVEFAARIGDRRTATAVIADAIQRDIASPDRLAHETPHISGRGAGVARAAIHDVLGGVRSAPEGDLAEICSRSRVLPTPLFNPTLLLPDDRRISPDALWADAGLVHETNSREHHAGEDSFEDTQSRHDALTSAGLTVLHNSPRQQLREPDRVLAQLEACYLRLAGSGLPPGVRLTSGHTHVPSVGL